MTKSIGSFTCKCRSEGEQGICNPQLGFEYSPNDVKIGYAQLWHAICASHMGEFALKSSKNNGVKWTFI